MIPTTFINYAADILGHTSEGLTGSQIAKILSAYSVDFNVEIPYSSSPFHNVPNKKTALLENLKRFKPNQQFQIIKYLCELPELKDKSDVKDLRTKLISKYGKFGNIDLKEELNESLIEETQHWLAEYPIALKIYKEGYEKYSNGIYNRNTLDDLRLSIETLLKQLLKNEKSLENQKESLGKLLKEKDVSQELTNMFLKLFDYFGKYQNEYVKHNDNVNDKEIEIIFELASSLMKFIVRINSSSSH